MKRYRRMLSVPTSTAGSCYASIGMQTTEDATQICTPLNRHHIQVEIESDCLVVKSFCSLQIEMKAWFLFQAVLLTYVVVSDGFAVVGANR